VFLHCFFCFFFFVFFLGGGLDRGGSICLSLLEDIPIVGRMIREKCFQSETKTVRYSGASEEVVWRRGRQREFVY
jgi:hypothetical protein